MAEPESHTSEAAGEEATPIVSVGGSPGSLADGGRLHPTMGGNFLRRLGITAHRAVFRNRVMVAGDGLASGTTRGISNRDPGRSELSRIIGSGVR